MDGARKPLLMEPRSANQSVRSHLGRGLAVDGIAEVAVMLEADRRADGQAGRVGANSESR